MDGSSRQTGIIENKLRKAAYFCLFHLEENCQTFRKNKYWRKLVKFQFHEIFVVQKIMEDSGSDWDSLPPQESLQKSIVI